MGVPKKVKLKLLSGVIAGPTAESGPEFQNKHRAEIVTSGSLCHHPKFKKNHYSDNLAISTLWLKAKDKINLCLLAFRFGMDCGV
jgi:hypothetical protein